MNDAGSRLFRAVPSPGSILSGVTAGLVAGMIIIPVEISLAALIFSGDLAAYSANAIGFMLFGCLVLSALTSLSSSFPSMIAVPQDGPAAILALAAAGIVASMPAAATSQQTFTTVAAAVAGTSLLTGALFLALGGFRLGELVRFVPYPVVGGFLAGTGLLLVKGTLGLLTGLPVQVTQLVRLFSPAVALRWMPAFAMAAGLVWLMRRRSRPLLIPATLLIAGSLFYLLLWLLGTTVAEAGAQGWFLGPFPSGTLWRLMPFESLGSIYWPAIWSQAGNVGTILLISVLSLLLNVSALELTARQEVDLNAELRQAGRANLVAGVGGGPPGYPALSLSALAHQIAPGRRLAGLTLAVLTAAVLFFAAPLLALLPKPVLGVVLLYLGLSFLAEWLYDTRFSLPKAEYVIVVLIVITMNTLGVLSGVGLGLLLALVLFVLSYSRIGVVRHALSGVTFRSNVDRSWKIAETLCRWGDWLYILELQGFLFFGTANQLLEQVRQRLQETERAVPRFVVLDFARVSGMDASAALSFSKIEQLAQAYAMELVLTAVSPQLRQSLARSSDTPPWRIEPDLDHGVEWCEEQILRLVEAEQGTDAGGVFGRRIEAADQDSPAAGRLAEPGTGGSARFEALLAAGLAAYMEILEVGVGFRLVQQGDAPCGLYYVQAGQVTAERLGPDGRVVRLRKMGPGALVGEMALYQGAVAAESVVTAEPSLLHYLPMESLRRLEVAQPDLASALHKAIAQLLVERLTRAHDTVHALLSGQPEPACAADVGQRRP